LKQSKRKTRNSKRPPGRSSAPPARRAPRARPARDTSTPQIRTGYAPAGRDTLAAIAEELGPDGPANVRPRDSDPGPEIEIAQTPAGRETIAAISEELAEQVSKEATSATLRDKAEPRSAAGHRGRTAAALPHRVGGRQLPDRSGASDAGSTPPPRPRMRTVGFSDPPPAAPDGPGSAERSGTGSKRRPDRAALDAIEQQLASWAQSGMLPSESGAKTDAPLEVFEMATFVVRGDLAHLSSSTARREFVAKRLLHRLPVRAIGEVDRIDVTPWTVRGTVIVRVWCRVPPRS
jgi:hypothetical protein